MAARGIDRGIDGRSPLDEERDRAALESDHDRRGEFEVRRRRRDARREDAGESEHPVGVAGTRDVDALDAPAVADEPDPHPVDDDRFEGRLDSHALARVPRAVADTGGFVAHRGLRRDGGSAAVPDRHEDGRAGELLGEHGVHDHVGAGTDRILRVDVEAAPDADGVGIAEVALDDRVHAARDPVDARRAAGDDEVEAAEVHVAEAVRSPVDRHRRVAVADGAGHDDAAEVAGEERVADVDPPRPAHADARDADVATGIGGEPEVQRGNVERALHGVPRHARGGHHLGVERGPPERELVARDDHVVRDRLGGEVRAVAHIADGVRCEEVPVPSIGDHAEARAGEGGVEAVRGVRREREPDLRPDADGERAREPHVDGSRVRRGMQVDRSHQHAAGPLVDELHIPEERVAARVGELAGGADGFDAEAHVADLDVALGAERGALESHILHARVDGAGNRAVVADRHDGRRRGGAVGRAAVGDAAVRDDPRVALGARAVVDRQTHASAADAGVGRRHCRAVVAAQRVAARTEADVAGALHGVGRGRTRPGRVDGAAPGVEDALVAGRAVTALRAEVALAGAHAGRPADRLTGGALVGALRGHELGRRRRG